MTNLRFLDAGESHGKALVGIIEGMPAGLRLTADDLSRDLVRRCGGYGRGGRMQIESDRAEILSGVRNSMTLGSPISFIIKNADHANWLGIMEERDCDKTARTVTKLRPGHADYAGCVKYGFSDARNVLERASARETAARVAAGGAAKAFLAALGITVGSHVLSIGGVKAEHASYTAPELIEKSDRSPVRCMDEQAGKAMMKKIDEARDSGDTLGGEVEIVVSGVPAGIGSYAHFDRKLDGRLMGAIGSVQSVKSVGIGDENCALLPGSEVHDEIFNENGKCYRRTNRAGGIEGGVTNGEDLIIHASLKPIPTLMKGLNTVDLVTHAPTTSATERSDVCAVAAAGVVIESVVAFVLADVVLESLGGDTMSEAIERMEKKRAAQWIQK